MGSIRHDGRAGTGCSSSSNCRKSFDDQAARASYVDGAPNPVKAHLLAHSLSGRVCKFVGDQAALVWALLGVWACWCRSSLSRRSARSVVVNFHLKLRHEVARSE
jgi:hypothetical protein